MESTASISMGTHRTPLDMKIQMLRLLQTEDRTQTALVYGALLNQTKGAGLIGEMLEKGAIGRNEEKKMFYLTPVGERAILLYDELRGLI